MEISSKKSFYKKMLSLAIPIALQQLLTSCAQLVDTAMVVGLGNTSTSAIGVAGRWSFLLNLALFGIGSGVATMTAQYWGVKNIKNIHRAYGAGIILGIAVGLVYSLSTFFIPEQMMRVFTEEQEVIDLGIGYLQNVSPYGIFLALSLVTSISMRSTEDVHTPLICSVVSVITNTVLNYMLIHGIWIFPELHLRGAAVATAFAMFLQALLMFIIGFAKKSIIFSDLREIFAFDRRFINKYVKICLPVMINELMWGAGTNVYTMVFARQGSENFAAYTIFDSVQQIAFVFFVGVCSACSIMLGKEIGAGKHEEGYKTAKRFMLLIVLMGFIIGGTVILIRYPLLRLLPFETEGAMHTAAKLLLIYALWVPLRNIPYICIVGIFRAGGDTKTGMFLDIGALFLISTPIVAYLGFCTEVPFHYLIAAMYIAEDTLKVILSLLWFRSRKWIRQITSPDDDT